MMPQYSNQHSFSEYADKPEVELEVKPEVDSIVSGAVAFSPLKEGVYQLDTNYFAAVSDDTVDSSTAVSDDSLDSCAAVSDHTVASSTTVSDDTLDFSAAVSDDTVDSSGAVSDDDIDSSATVIRHSVGLSTGVNADNVDSPTSVSVGVIDSSIDDDIDPPTVVCDDVVNSSTAISDYITGSSTAVSDDYIDLSTSVSDDAFDSSTAVSDDITDVSTAVSDDYIHSSTAVSDDYMHSSTAVSDDYIQSSTAGCDNINGSSTAVSDYFTGSSTAVRDDYIHSSTAGCDGTANSSTPVCVDAVNSSTAGCDDIDSSTTQSTVSDDNITSSTAVCDDAADPSPAVSDDAIGSCTAVCDDVVNSCTPVSDDDVDSSTTVSDDDIDSSTAVSGDDVDSATCDSTLHSRARRVVSDGSIQRRVTSSMIQRPELVNRIEAFTSACLHPDLQTDSIIKETIEKERIFVSRLLLLQHVKQIMQRTNSERAYADQHDLDNLFPQLSQVIALHKDHILSALEQEVARAESGVSPLRAPLHLGRIFKNAGKFLLLHMNLACKQRQSTRIIRKLVNEHRHLKHSINQLLDALRADQVNLEILLAEPRTRLYNFKLLFESYIKQLNKLESGCEDLKSAEDAHTIIADVLNQIDHTIRKEEMQEILLQLRAKFRHLQIEIMRPGRELIDTAEMEVFNPRNGTYQHCQVYLLDDMLIVEKKQVLECTGLDGTNVEMVTPRGILVFARREVIELRAGDVKVAEKWTCEIDSRCHGGASRIAYQIGDPCFPLGRRAPRLGDLTKVHTCAQCDSEVKVKDRNHCEACGRVLCRSCCSDRKVRLAFRVDAEEQRVCVNCWSRLRIITRDFHIK